MLNHSLKKSALIYVFATLAASSLVCCNNDFDPVDDTYTSCVVTSFKFSANDSVMRGLDSVFFSIDLNTFRIYNADSLPYGTRVDRLVPEITMLESASVAELTVKRAGRADTVYNYLANPGDSIDFSYAPVSLRIGSYDGSVTRTYTIDVNVHKVKSDSLCWDRARRTPLPSAFNYPNEQWSAATADAVYCLTRYQSDYSIAWCANPGADDWQLGTPAFGFVPEMCSLRATDSALYIQDSEGNVYTSADGLQWSACGFKAHYLYGGFEDTLLVSQQQGTEWHIVSWPAGFDMVAPKGMPVEACSMPVAISFELGTSQQILVTGGRTADGNLIGSTWGFDGSQWAEISAKPLPKGLEWPTVVPYFTYKYKHNFWEAGDYTTLIALGGNGADGKPNATVYTSTDYGMTWQKAPAVMQLPDYVPAMTQAQGFVYKSMLTSRVTRPIDEWECPYIYIFGGTDGSVMHYNTVWSAVINRYTFKPLY